ncbi:MAG: AbrB/MazE/SpoVT family DNA-binding domain-containing protein [Anaerolineae bacterium]|nr:AbrB/MazE/SpoVT family DNA-binding domain-containing protein [Anaerolineae bacterium]
MTENLSVKVSKRYQIAVPQLARQQLNIQSGDRLLVDIQDGMIILIPKPASYTRHLAGLHKSIWEDSTAQYDLDKERNAWADSANA